MTYDCITYVYVIWSAVTRRVYAVCGIYAIDTRKQYIVCIQQSSGIILSVAISKANSFCRGQANICERNHVNGELSHSEKIQLQELLQMYQALPGQVDTLFGESGSYNRR